MKSARARRSSISPLGDGLPALHLKRSGQWGDISLRSPAIMQADCAAAARAIIVDGPESALLRRQVRAHLAYSATTLRDLGAVQFAVGIRLDGVTPLPCTLVVFRAMELDVPSARSTDATAVIGALERAIDEADAGGDRLERERRRVTACGAVALRRHRIYRGRREAAEGWLDSADGSRYIRRLHVQYLVPIPGTTRLTDVVFDTPLGEIAGAMLELFDSFLEESWFDSAVPQAGARAG